MNFLVYFWSSLLMVSIALRTTLFIHDGYQVQLQRNQQKNDRFASLNNAKISVSTLDFFHITMEIFSFFTK